MERTAVCALSCPYGENYPSSSDFRWIAASNSADLAGVGRGGHFRFPAATPAAGAAGERSEEQCPGAAAAPRAPSLPHPAPCPASTGSGPSPARAGAAGALCRRPVRFSHSCAGIGCSTPALTPTAVSGCWQRDLAAVKGLTEQHGRCPPAARCSPEEQGAPSGDSPQWPDLCRCSCGEKSRTSDERPALPQGNGQRSDAGKCSTSAQVLPHLCTAPR